ncbi:MAG: helix-turn-helix domain-containing protein [Acidimicrobiia bacterium]|nr:helix-turn-helix domain-containing protein [Acidimicrobiia bacterium]
MTPAPTLTVDQARTDILAAADALFYTRGIGAVRMADIRDRSGVSLRRLYSLYPHKTDLVTGWLDHRHTTWIDTFTNGIDDRLRSGEPPVDAVFGSLEHWLTTTNFRGCGFINALAETGEVTDEHRRIIRHHKQTLVNLLARFTAEPAALAVLLDGAIVQAAVFASTDPVDAARVAAIPLFDR